MEKNVINKDKKTTNLSFFIDQLSVQQLIDLSIDSNNDNHVEIETRKELIERGKDNIQARIIIKKVCKSAISSLETLLQSVTSEKNNDKEIVKSFKGKFLNAVSILDKLELEWQKHDLGINKS